MKAIAIIFSGFLLLMNTGHLLETLQAPVEVAASECCADCAPGCCDPEEKPEESKQSCHGDSPCTPGCACSCDFQLNALAFDFMELDGSAVQSYHYGNYQNTYTFEYSGEFLQPPRKV